MFRRYRYESEYYSTLSRVPLDVRMKLDLTGVKISLKDWLAFSLEERTVLCHLPIEAADERRAFIDYLGFLSRSYRGEPLVLTNPMSSSLWEGSNRIPAPVADKSAAKDRPVTAAEWTRWDTHQRYALYKSAISKSEPEAFSAILEELREAKN